MNTYAIPESLVSSYRGDGWALAATLKGQIVAIRYIVEIAPAIAERLEGPHAPLFVKQWLGTLEAMPIVRELQALGNVSAGMCSNWEFLEQ
ncbi:hypothetical protein EKL30_03520 [Candidimonas sp. SYP-B2681]|uniref:hypothetical protein n=1 Tax=Candidimonas sp. SYP-B2681 TaxID=2497686 RepID=UPI000F86F001|nr:hypothetical protein [Candidimonas sp. SYP-B2681]RTZ48045.1 hypothetical protein EKL30_03520 [Candidimonas sp. SYP-B2681]